MAETAKHTQAVAKTRLPRPVRAARPAPPATPTITIPLRRVLEEIDSATSSPNLTQALVAAARAARLVEYAWRSGLITLTGRKVHTNEPAVIKPPLGKTGALDRFGGRDGATPIITLSRNWRREVWHDIGIDADGAQWLRMACAGDPRKIPRAATPISDAHTFNLRDNAEMQCAAWLADLMRQGPPARNYAHYESEARRIFGIAVRGFRRAWSTAIMLTGNDSWAQSGPKKPRAMPISAQSAMRHSAT